MDWSRAKSILIVAFLLTNIFLIFNLYNEHRDLSVSVQEINEVTQILNEKGIKINANIPRNASIPGILTVEYQEFSPAQLTSSFFGEENMKPVKQNGSTIFIKDEKKLEIKNNREIIYLDLKLRDDPRDDLTSNDATNISKEILRRTGLFRSSMIVDRVVPSKKGYYITYVQEYEDVLLEVSFVQLEVTPRGVYSLYMLWLNPKNMEKDRKKIVPASQALLKVVSRKEFLKETPTRIDDIRLVYYFNWKEAKEGEAFPAWKIVVDGENFYVNALTGQFDK